MPEPDIDIEYGPDDRPPGGLWALVTIQLTVVLGLPLIYPVVVFKAAGTPLADIPSVLSWGLFVLAGITVLNASRRPFGTGYLMPPLSSALYLQPSVAAVGLGGPTLLAGMTMLAGAAEVLFSTVITRLRRLFPPAVTGLVVLIVGAEIGLTAVKLGVDAVRSNEASDVVEIGISVVTYMVIVMGVVWGSLLVRNFAPILGIVVGSVLSAILVTLPDADAAFVGSTSIVGSPGLPPMSFDFEFSLAIPFIVIGLAAGLRTIGVIMTLHGAAHPGEGPTARPEVSHAVRNDGVGAAAAGLVGFVGVSSATSAIGVSVATGIMSRVVAITLAGALVVLAFSPRALSYLVTAPAAVVSALLVYYASYMFVGGLRLMIRQHLDLRMTFVIGTSLSVALGARFYGVTTTTDNDWVTLTTGSMLTMGVLTAVVLNLIFRVGQGRQATFVVHVDDERAGGDPIGPVTLELRRALDDVHVEVGGERSNEAAHLGALVAREIVERGLADGDVSARVATDDVQLLVELTYQGEPLAVGAHRPVGDEQFADENVFVAGLEGFFDVPRPDDVSVRTRGREVTLTFVYDVV